jgi:probable DNA repair protein
MTSQPNSSLILCSTPRLAVSLQQHHQREQLEKGFTQWSPINAMTPSQWLKKWLEEAVMLGRAPLEAGLLTELTPLEEGLLWERAIEESLKHFDAKELFDTAGLATAAVEANRYMVEWEIAVFGDYLTEETQQFLVWRERFQSLCHERRKLEPVRFAEHVIKMIKQGHGELPAHIEFAGFDVMHPQLERLQAALEERKRKVTTKVLTLDGPQASEHIELVDRDAECRAAVAWAKAQLDQNPKTRIAIVVPELPALRTKLASLLDDALEANVNRPALAESQRAYDFSIGPSLTSQAIINTALNLLKLVYPYEGRQDSPVFHGDVAYLLHSPYWSKGVTEADGRAQLDAELRKTLSLSFKLSQLQRSVEKLARGERALHLPALREALKALLALRGQSKVNALPSVWAERFQSALLALDWPGERTLSSVEYQAKKSFERLLSELAGLDSLLGKIDVQQAIRHFTKMCQAKIFQPESRNITNLQVMGMMEAAAAPLDAIWVMGMNDHVWPPPAKPNPLVPAALQHSKGTPNANSEVQTKFAGAIHKRLRKSAHQIIFSSAQQDGERVLRVSPLMVDISPSSRDVLLFDAVDQQLANSRPKQVGDKPWDWLEDHQAPGVGEGERVSGGTGLLKAQAVCPAWAFHQYRLYARELKEPVDGLDAMDRGTLVHHVLELFWRDRDSEILKEPPEVLLATLEAVADAALLKFNADHDDVFSETFLTLEKERLVELIMMWLDNYEKPRPAFEVVACEEEREIEIEGVKIKVVVDRIDQLNNGHRLIMDYKTGGAVDFKNWGEDVITEPQLPIYAAFSPTNQAIAGVIFARVRWDESKFSGVLAQKGLIKGVRVFNEVVRGSAIFDAEQFPDWDSVIAYWRKNLTGTILSLKAGDAAVRIQDEQDLKYCEVSAILRVAERALQFEHVQKLNVNKVGDVSR